MKNKAPNIAVDMINHPPHYMDESGIESITIAEKLSFCGGNCFKYLYRAGRKENTVEDLEKAQFYAKRCKTAGYTILKAPRELVIEVAKYRDGVRLLAFVAFAYSDWDSVIDYITEEINNVRQEL